MKLGWFQEVVRELEKVSWPDRQHTLNQTVLVIVVSLGLAVYLGALDFIFTRLLGVAIERL